MQSFGQTILYGLALGIGLLLAIVGVKVLAWLFGQAAHFSF